MIQLLFWPDVVLVCDFAHLGGCGRCNQCTGGAE